MKNVRMPQPPRQVVLDDGTKSNAGTDWFMVVLFLCAAVAAQWYFKAPLNFDFNSPDFNPFVFVPLISGAICLRYLFPAIRGTLVNRKFGRTVLEMDEGSAELGATLKGVIRSSVEVAPTSDYVINVQCIEAITRMSSMDQKNRKAEHIRWEATRRVDPKTVNAKRGIPVEFQLPTTALATGDERAEGVIRWVMDVKAPLSGTDFYAIFAFVVRPQKRG
jgi:hypothetical protein